MKPKKPEELIKEARDKKGLTQQEVADFLGISLRSYQHIESGRFPIFKKEPIRDLDEKLGISVYGVVYPNDKKSYSDFVKLATEETGSVVNEEPSDYLSVRRKQKNVHNGPMMVPLVPIAAQAGYAQHCYDMSYIEKLETYPILPGVDPHGASWRYFQIRGESMEPTFKNGQYILASQVIKDDWRNIENSYVYVIITADGVIIKRLFKVKGKDYWAVISDNPDEVKYPQFKLYVKDVVELWKFRRKVDWDAPVPRKIEVKV